MKDVLGLALWDYYYHLAPKKLWIYNTYGPKEEMPVATYFRNKDNMSDIELKALEHCKGTVLDIGAGAGSHALWLQDKGLEVTAMDTSAKAVAVMQARGVKNAVQQDIFTAPPTLYHTLLMLMNGIGLTANLAGLQNFLTLAKQFLHPGGQLLFDSSDVAYLYEKGIPDLNHYYGEIQYQYAYKRQKTDWFTWLYIDQQTLIPIAQAAGWQTEILMVDEYDQYLARLTPSI